MLQKSKHLINGNSAIIHLTEAYRHHKIDPTEIVIFIFELGIPLAISRSPSTHLCNPVKHMPDGGTVRSLGAEGM